MKNSKVFSHHIPEYKTQEFLNFGRLPGPLPRPRNRAFRSKSSDLPMQILWAFRFNPLARVAAAAREFAKQIRGPIIAGGN
jgi:hypothetical protein